MSNVKKQNILIIGAGAVGTVYGYFLAKHHQVTYFVKQKYVQELQQGYQLQLFNEKKHPIVKVIDYQVTSHINLTPSTQWDIIIITLSTTALPKLDLSQVNTTGSTLVLLSPGLEDVAQLKNTLADKAYGSIVTGMINLISYVTTQESAKTTHVWFPPLAAMPFSSTQGSDQAVAQQVAHTFNHAGIKAKAVASSLKAAIYPNIFLTVFVLALEAANWSFAQLKTAKPLQQQMLASIKAFNQASKQHYQLAPAMYDALLAPFMVKLGLSLAPRLFPFNIEAYLQQHFIKVQSQSYTHAQGYIELCKQYGVNAEAARALLSQAQQAGAS